MAITKIKEPAFHITGESGWINDPNGLIYYKDQYHAFFQYNPYDTKWGPMHWGHVVSDDLTNWRYLPIALVPGDDFDKDGCFSGSAIVQDGKLWLIYTGYIENQGKESVRQIQCLASSTDGVTFQKHGVVIGENDLPNGYAPCDFRDPKIWFHNDSFWCIIAARRVEGKGRILLYKSKDLFNWEFVNDLFGTDSAGTMIECPDYNEELGYLLFCEQFQPSENGIHLNIHTCRSCVGRINYSTGRFEEEARSIVDYGFDVYAPQTFAGKPIILGWLNMWDRNVPSEKYGFAGMLTVARRVFIEGGRLCQEPIINTTGAHTAVVCDKFKDKIDKGVITIKAVDLEALDIKMRSNGDKYTRLTLNDGQWVFDRSKSGEEIIGAEKDEDSLNGIRRMPYSNQKETTLTIVMDDYSVEIFENGRVLSSTIYPPSDANEFELTVKANSCLLEKANVK